MLVNTKKMLINAQKNKYAVGAFNFTNIMQMKTILKVANDLNSPVILSASSGALKFIGADIIVSVAKTLEKQYNIDFAIHLDHGTSFEICKLAIDSGFTSVMIDASMHSIDENIKITNQVIKYAKMYNVTTEAELGVLAGVEDNIKNEKSLLTDPNESYHFIKKTNVDSLAISIGTSHGAYKFKGTPNLDFSRLKEIKNKINTPLVLHGASSLDNRLISEPFKNSGGKLENAKGVPLEMLINAVDNGICKINIDTDLRVSYTTGLRKALNNCSEFNIRKYQKEGLDQMSIIVAYLIENVVKSSNKNT